MPAHTFFDGRLQIYKRGGKNWNCAAMVGGQRFRSTTGVESLEQAKDVAEEWYLTLRGKLREGKIVPNERTFGQAAEEYLKETKVLATSVRSARYVDILEMRLNVHVLPYFTKLPLSAVNKGAVQTYRVNRAEKTIEKTTVRDDAGEIVKKGKPPARSTMLQEIVIIRQVLKHAEGLGWIKFVPNLSTAYMTQGKKGRRAWFDHDDYKKLREAAQRRIKDGTRRGWKSRYEDMYDFIIFMANTGVRPDEAWNLQLGDVKIVNDFATKETILDIDVRGKTGSGYCVSLPAAVYAFKRLQARRTEEYESGKYTADNAKMTLAQVKLFPRFDRDLFNTLLKEEGLKHDRDGQVRTAYSLRHTYISMRLIEGANIHQVANNCRTSVQMIEEHYGHHMKDRRDVSAINVQRKKVEKKADRKRTRSRSSEEE